MSSRSSRPSPVEVAEDPLEHLPTSAVVAVAMSGGVDSSVVAARVAQRGLRAVGITLAMWASEREVVRDRGCCSIDAVEDARRVASALGMPHYVWNLEAEFEALVVHEFEEEYALGRTPNPCTRCNERVKFGVLLERARGIGATHLATGHYFTPSGHLIQTAGIAVDVDAPQDLPDDLKPTAKVKEKDQPPLQSYIPSDPKADKALNAAYALLRKPTVDAHAQPPNAAHERTR